MGGVIPFGVAHALSTNVGCTGAAVGHTDVRADVGKLRHELHLHGGSVLHEQSIANEVLQPKVVSNHAQAIRRHIV
jgi:hypothetical protein